LPEFGQKKIENSYFHDKKDKKMSKFTHSFRRGLKINLKYKGGAR